MNVSIQPIKQNYNIVSVGNLTLWFSYQTCIAIHTGYKLIISKNVWSKTTGKHLNQVDPDKTKRLDYEEFKKQLDVHLQRINVVPNRFNPIN